MLFGLIPYGEAIFQLTVATPLQLFYLLMLTRLVDIRYKRAFWACEVFCNIVPMVFRMAMLLWLRVFFMLFVNIALPIALSKGLVLFRISVSLMGMVFSTLAEGVMSLSFLLVTGASSLSDMGVSVTSTTIFVAPFAFYFSLLMGILAVAVLFSSLRFVLDRFGMAGSDGATSSGAFLPVFIVIAQFAVFFFILAWCFLQVDSNVVSAAGALILSPAMVVAVLVFYISARRYESKSAADLHAEALQVGVQERMAAYARVVERIENVAKLRHDLRNQAQAALLAAESGERGRARAQVAEMLEVARGTDGLYARTGKDKEQR